MNDSFGARSRLKVGERGYEIFRLETLARAGIDISRLPYSLRILLEDLLRTEDGVTVTGEDIEALARWSPRNPSTREIAFTPARVLLQDFTGVPAVVDLAAMRDAMAELGGDPRRINPLQPVELVVDHSVQVDAFGTPQAFLTNVELDYQRNRERYQFLRWGQRAFDNFRVVPPNTGIVHQVNLEYLARVVFTSDENPHARTGELPQAYPDTLVGTDSHTPMVNGLGVLGWGVGGIEAEAAMLGQPVSMLIPEVIGFRLEGRLPEGATATDLVLTVTELLRRKGVVGKFVEFYGPGLDSLALADRATIGNMSPEYGATCAIFPVDAVTLQYLRFTGRSEERVALVEAYMKEQGLFHTAKSPDPVFTDTLSLDLSTVEPSIAGPRRPQDRIRLSEATRSFQDALPSLLPAGSAPPGKEAAKGPSQGPAAVGVWGEGSSESPSTRAVMVEDAATVLDHGSVVIAAITSCTNTSNPSVMLAAGLLARKAVERGLERKPWVKTSLAPGSTVVTDYLKQAGLDEPLDALGFNLVGYGCTTCIGNSGPLPEEISKAVNDNDLVVCSVLSGNRNFEGRINQDTRNNYLASPPLCVAYALAGRMDIDLLSDPLGEGADGAPVYLRDIWPTNDEVKVSVAGAVRSDMFTKSYADVFTGDERWRGLETPDGDRYTWPDSTYVRRPSFFEGMEPDPAPVQPIEGARVLAVLGDSVTTDHISPAGAIKKASPAGEWLIENGVEVRDFNSYGSRRGNHEVMIRGTFANIRLRNALVEREGGFTRHFPGGEETTIYEAAMQYAGDGIPLVVLAGKEYGSGSSRDWAAKGTALLGVRAVIAQSFERIHRSNLIGMGVLPLQFPDGETRESLGLTGEELITVGDLQNGEAKSVAVTATRDGAEPVAFEATVRLDTPNEIRYFQHGGILHRVLRELR
jgi:aconitate hydratase A / 2-methylisocitrate dehydratase